MAFLQLREKLKNCTTKHLNTFLATVLIAFSRRESRDLKL